MLLFWWYNERWRYLFGWYKKSYETYENILIYVISYNIRFDEIDGFIKIYDGSRYLVLFDHGWFHRICNRIKYSYKQKLLLQVVLIIILE